MTQIDEIYNTKLFEIAARMPYLPLLKRPDARVRAHSALCGSSITVDLCMQDQIISGYGQEVKTCLLGQAAAAIVGDKIIGSTVQEFRKISEQMRRILQSDGVPPGGRWIDLALLQSVRDYPTRHASTLLVFDAVEDAIERIEKANRQDFYNHSH